MRALLLAWTVAALCGACSDDAQTLDDAAVIDAPVADGPGGPDASCFTNPTTHLEIINACTTAEQIDKRPILPLQLPDGGLPPLP